MAGLGVREAEYRDAEEDGSAANPASEAAERHDAHRCSQGDGVFLVVLVSIAAIELAVLSIWLLGS
jgi:hypothetical protein